MIISGILSSAPVSEQYLMRRLLLYGWTATHWKALCSLLKVILGVRKECVYFQICQELQTHRDAAEPCVYIAGLLFDHNSVVALFWTSSCVRRLLSLNLCRDFGCSVMGEREKREDQHFSQMVVSQRKSLSTLLMWMLNALGQCIEDEASTTMWPNKSR